MSDPLTTFLELATVLPLDALVSVGDHLVFEPFQLDPHDIRPYLELSDLRSGIDAASGRGIRLAREAGDLVRSGCASPAETDLRLLVIRADLPEPVCGAEVRDARGRIGWFDLVWPEWHVIAEYDGDQHRTSRQQYEKDMYRFDRATEAGWRVIRVRAWGLYRRPEDTLARLRNALRSAGWTPR